MIEPATSAKDKASEMIAEFQIAIDMNTSKAFDPSNGHELNQSAKSCALIAVEALVAELTYHGIDAHYWINVKKEIENHQS